MIRRDKKWISGQWLLWVLGQLLTKRIILCFVPWSHLLQSVHLQMSTIWCSAQIVSTGMLNLFCPRSKTILPPQVQYGHNYTVWPSVAVDKKLKTNIHRQPVHNFTQLYKFTQCEVYTAWCESLLNVMVVPIVMVMFSVISFGFHLFKQKYFFLYSVKRVNHPLSCGMPISGDCFGLQAFEYQLCCSAVTLLAWSKCCCCS